MSPHIITVFVDIAAFLQMHAPLNHRKRVHHPSFRVPHTAYTHSTSVRSYLHNTAPVLDLRSIARRISRHARLLSCRALHRSRSSSFLRRGHCVFWTPTVALQRTQTHLSPSSFQSWPSYM